MISDTTRHNWNHLVSKIGIGRIAKLDHHDLDWLLEIGAAAVAWHEQKGIEPLPIIASQDDPRLSKRKPGSQP